MSCEVFVYHHMVQFSLLIQACPSFSLFLKYVIQGIVCYRAVSQVCQSLIPFAKDHRLRHPLFLSFYQLSAFRHTVIPQKVYTITINLKHWVHANTKWGWILNECKYNYIQQCNWKALPTHVNHMSLHAVNSEFICFQLVFIVVWY